MGRRRGYNTVPWTKAFTPIETGAVTLGISELHRRALYHLVRSQFTLPSLPEVYRSLIDKGVWDHMSEAQRIMVQPRNSYSFYAFETTMPIGANLATMHVKSTNLLPDVGLLPPNDVQVPSVLQDYAMAALECQRQWAGVIDVFERLNSNTKRATAAYYWPCAQLLMKLGKEPRDDLGDVQRPGILPADLTVDVRNTTTFVMQHSMLPPLPDGNVAMEGDEDDLAGWMMLDEIHPILSQKILPL